MRLLLLALAVTLTGEYGIIHLDLIRNLFMTLDTFVGENIDKRHNDKSC